MDRDILKEFERKVITILDKGFESIQKAFQAESVPLLIPTDQKKETERVYVPDHDFQPCMDDVPIITREVAK